MVKLLVVYSDWSWWGPVSEIARHQGEGVKSYKKDRVWLFLDISGNLNGTFRMSLKAYKCLDCFVVFFAVGLGV